MSQPICMEIQERLKEASDAIILYSCYFEEKKMEGHIKQTSSLKIQIINVKNNLIIP